MEKFDYFERKPKSLKVLQSTYRKDREEKEQPNYNGLKEIPKPASWVNTTGKRVFRNIIKDLAESGLLVELDLSSLNAACNEFGKYIEYEKLIKKEGIKETGTR